MTIPEGSTVLVTGANGYIASHVVDQLLQAGYRVRGTVRSLDKLESLIALWEKTYGAGRFEPVVVSDISKDGAFDEAVKGVSGIAHVASNLSFSADPNDVIPGVIASVNSILASAAAASPTVKSLVYTSSSTALTRPIPNTDFTVDASTWNDADVEAAWAPPPYNDERKWAVYGASKTQGERAVWEFVEKEKPGFVVNAVLPNCNFGRILVEDQVGSTAGWVRKLYQGDTSIFRGIPPQWFVDVQDTARLHVAALTNPGIKNERIFAYAEPTNAYDLLLTLRKIKPDHKFPDDFSDPNDRDLMKIDNSRGAALLKDFGRPGWTGLEESLRNNIEGFA